MTDLKLRKLPDRTPVKLTITIAPALHRALHAYAELYRDAYGQAEPVNELIPYMLETFLASDRTYAKVLKDRPDEAVQIDHAPRTRRKRRPPDASASPAEK